MALDTKRIEKTVRKLRKLVNKAPKRPSLDNIHDLRTYTRRFEATEAALKLDSRRNERRLLRDLARARKRAGKIRDMDVLTSYVTDVDSGQRKNCLVQLIEYLGAERYRHADRLTTWMRKHRSQMRRRLKRSARRLEKMSSTDGKQSPETQDAATAKAMASAAKLSQELAGPARLNRNNLHLYRLKVKELRYILQMANSSETRPFIDSLGEVKDAIGEWHDWEELIAIASDLDGHGPQCELVQELKTISDRKYERALSLTNRMKKTYLRGVNGSRRQPSAGKLKPVQPMLHAVAGIAS